MTVAWPVRLLTIEEWEALPEDESVDLELVEGVLSVVPKPRSFDQNASVDLTYLVKHQLPGSLIALSEVEVIVSAPPPTIRVPDMIVVRTEVFEGNPARIAAEDVLLATEILSEGTRRVDRILKFAEYADAGIAQYWLLDLDGAVTLTTYVLVDGIYELTGRHTGTATLDVAGHPVTLDLDALVRR